MGWLIGGLLLVLAGGLAVFTRWHRRRPVSDASLLAELLGTPVRPPAARPEQGQAGVPAPRPPAGADPRAAAESRSQLTAASKSPLATGSTRRLTAGSRPAPAAEGSAQPAAEASAQPAAEASWLETQLAWISAWSERMHDEIAGSAPGPAGPPTAEREAAPARPADPGRPADHERAGPPPARPAAQRCAATTAKGGQCKLPARPGETTCAIHARRAHP